MYFLKLLLILIGKNGKFAAPSHYVVDPWCSSRGEEAKRVLLDHVVIHLFDLGLRVGTQSIGVVCTVLGVAFSRDAIQMRDD